MEKKKAQQTFTRNSPTTDFRTTFLYNRRCLNSGKFKSRDENKVAATEQGNFIGREDFYFEKYIKNQKQCFSKFRSLAHLAKFTLVFTRNGIVKYLQKLTMTSIFIISDRAAIRGTFRIEANQHLRWSFMLAR